MAGLLDFSRLTFTSWLCQYFPSLGSQVLLFAAKRSVLSRESGRGRCLVSSIEQSAHQPTRGVTPVKPKGGIGMWKMQKFILATNCPSHHLACQPKALVYKAQFPAYLRHPCHPSGLDKCTFAGTFTKQLCLPGPHLVCLRNGDALALFSGG